MNDKNPIESDMDHLFSNPEAWESWESKLVIYSILTAIVSLSILAIIINTFLLK